MGESSGMGSTVHRVWAACARRRFLRAWSGGTGWRSAWLCGALVVALASLALGCVDEPSPGQAQPPKIHVAPEPEFSVGVFPYLPSLKLETVYAPVTRSFSKILGSPVRFHSKPTFRKFSEELATGAYDVALVQPFDYIEATKRRYAPLARMQEPLRGIFVAKKSLGAEGLAWLRGKTLATPPPGAAVTRLCRAAIAKAKLRESDVEVVSHPTHPSCLQAVLVGDADACCTARAALRLYPAGKNVLVEVAETRAIAHVLFVAHERVSAERRAALARLIIGWKSAAPELLKQLGMTGFVAAVPADYDLVRALAAPPP